MTHVLVVFGITEILLVGYLFTTGAKISEYRSTTLTLGIFMLVLAAFMMPFPAYTLAAEWQPPYVVIYAGANLAIGATLLLREHRAAFVN